MRLTGKIKRLINVESTSNYVAKSLADGSIPCGTVIMAQNQTKGRGQREAEWQSENGKNLLFSFCYKPDALTLNRSFALAQATTLALTDFFRSQSILITIKWPNDLLLLKKKIGGILIEPTVRSQRIDKAIIGVGINLNQMVFEGLPNAGSIKMLTGSELDPYETLQKMIDHINFRFAQLDSANYEVLHHNYLSQLLGYKSIREYEANGRRFLAEILNVLPSGHLLLADKTSGSAMYYDLKEVKLIY